MKLALLHHTTQPKAIKIIKDHLNEQLEQEYPGIEVIDPEKEWEDHIMRFSFSIKKMVTLDFSGTVIVTDNEVIGESEIPGLVTTFISEEKIKEIIKQRFNELFPES